MVNTEAVKCTTSLRELELNAGQKLPLKNPKGEIKSSLLVRSVEVSPVVTFAELLKQGVQISLIGAIDFTYSNGGATNPSSLHYVCPGKQNQYEQALEAVGTILANYDSDQQYPFYGFGAIPPGQKEVSHCFPISGDQQIKGIDNVLAAYRALAPKVQMAGPTFFAPVLRQAIQHVEKDGLKKMHYVLMILTDGEIHDMKETIAAIVDISTRNLPLSIVIVGVGNEDFANMVKLDGDDVALATGCKDQVQFVKFSEVVKRSEPGKVKENLAAIVLEEVPSQVVAAFSKRK